MGTDNSPGLKWRAAVAGCAAGLVPVLALHPLDVIKTRLQVQDGVRGVLPLYRGVTDAVSSMVRQEGWRSLYAGLAPAFVGAGVSWGIYFAAYNRAKARYQRRAGPTAKLGPQMHLAAAAEAGALVCCVTNPIWVVKTRLELQRGAGAVSAATAGGASAAAAAAAAAAAGRKAGRTALPPYRGMVDAVKQIAREEGAAGFYRGLGPSLLLVSHGAIQFMVYEELRSLSQRFGSTSGSRGRQQEAHEQQQASSSDSGLWGWRRRGEQDSGNGTSGSAKSKSSGSGGGAGAAVGQLRQPSSAEIVGMGALSKLVASVITYPSQVVRSRLQQRMARRAIRYRSGWDVLRITLRREGPGGLYKGLLPNVLRVMPQAALTFLVYETIMKQLAAAQERSFHKQESA